MNSRQIFLPWDEENFGQQPPSRLESSTAILAASSGSQADSRDDVPPTPGTIPAVRASAAAQKRQSTRMSRLAAEFLSIEREEAKQAGALGYIGRFAVQATLPHSDPSPEYSFERRNGNYTLSITAPKSVGLPYGTYPRLILIWMTGEVVRTQSSHLLLGRSLSDFMAQLGKAPTGGRNGTITQLREQLNRLFSSMIRLAYHDDGHDTSPGFLLAEDYELWWKKRDSAENELWQSWIDLGPKFFAELRDHSVPVDLRRVKLLQQSPLLLDIYTWWTYRFSYLNRPTEVPWEALYQQFGASYTTLRDFKRNFLLAAAKVQRRAYPEAKVEEGKRGLILKPSATSVRKLPPPQPRNATPAAAERWTRRFSGKFLKFRRELELIAEARAGRYIVDQDAELRGRVELAAHRANVPLEVAYALCGCK